MGWQEFPMRMGHAPDLDSNSPDAWQIIGAIPLEYGYGSDLAWDVATSGGVGVPLGASLVYTVDATAKYFVGTNTKLYQYAPSSGAFTDRSGTTYGATTSQTWSFAQFGDNTMAVNKGNKVQRSTGASFADAATAAPKGSIIVNVGFPASPQLMVFDYDDGSNNYRDGWYCSALSSDTDWVNSIATGSASGRLLEPAGPILCAVPFRDGVLAFKANAMYYGEYVGGTTVWSWRRLSSAIGCIGKNAAVNGEDVVFFADTTGFFMFDGSYPRKLPGYVHKSVQLGGAVVQSLPNNFVHATYDSKTNTVRWVWAIDNLRFQGVCFNITSQTWTGVGNVSTFVFAHAGPYYGFNLSGQPLHQSSTRAECTVMSPRFGMPHGATLSGVWPQFFTTSMLNNPTGIPATTDAAWANDAFFYGYSFPQASAASTVTPAVDAGGILRGSVSGKGVAFRLDIKPAETTSDWKLGKMLVDVRYAPKE